MNEVIFFDVWYANSGEEQEALIAEMRAVARALSTKPGFLSLTVWTSEGTTHRVLVQGRWASRAHFDNAIESPEMRQVCGRLEKFGESELGFFGGSFRIGSKPQDQVIPSSEAITFIQVWEVGAPEHQEGWLATMRDNVGVLTGKPGFGSMHTHSSADGKRVAVYAQWRDGASLEATISLPEAQAGHQAMRAHGTPDGAIYHLTDVFLPNPAVPLVEKVSNRWAALGFETNMVNVNGVDLHLASGGRGSPLVLLHGYPQSGEIWRFVAPELAKTHRVIIPDLRGMGLSGIVRDGFDLLTIADDMHQLIARLDHEQVQVVGHDWGGAVGAVWALRHPGNIRKLAFIESAVGGAGFESMWAFNHPNPAMTFIPFLLTDPLAESLIAGREEIFLHHLWDTFTHNKNRVPFHAWEPYVDAMKRPGLIRSSASFYRSVYAAVDRVRELIGTGKLTIPVLSVAGQASFGEAQKPFVEAFANHIANHVTIENSGHFVAEEQPEALMAELGAFLAT